MTPEKLRENLRAHETRGAPEQGPGDDRARRAGDARPRGVPAAQLRPRADRGAVPRARVPDADPAAAGVAGRRTRRRRAGTAAGGGGRGDGVPHDHDEEGSRRAREGGEGGGPHRAARREQRRERHARPARSASRSRRRRARRRTSRSGTTRARRHGSSSRSTSCSTRCGRCSRDAKLQKVTHNGQFDFLVLANHGVTMRGMRFDTMIAAYLLGESNITIQNLAFDRLNMQDPAADRPHRQGGQEPAHDGRRRDRRRARLLLRAGRRAAPRGRRAGGRAEVAQPLAAVR